MSGALCSWDPPALSWRIVIPHGSVRSDFWFRSSLFKPSWLKGTFNLFSSHYIPHIGSENTQLLLHGKCDNIHASFHIFCPFEFEKKLHASWKKLPILLQVHAGQRTKLSSTFWNHFVLSIAIKPSNYLVQSFLLTLLFSRYWKLLIN